MSKEQAIKPKLASLILKRSLNTDAEKYVPEIGLYIRKNYTGR